MPVIAYALAFLFLLVGVGPTKADRLTDQLMQEWTAGRDASRQSFCKGKWPGDSKKQLDCNEKQERAGKIVEVYTKTVIEMVESKVPGMKPIGLAVFKMWGLCSTVSATAVVDYVDTERMQACFAVQWEIYQELSKALRS